MPPKTANPPIPGDQYRRMLAEHRQYPAEYKGPRVRTGKDRMARRRLTLLRAVHTPHCIWQNTERVMGHRDGTRCLLTIVLGDYAPVSRASKCAEYLCPNICRKS